MLKDVMVRLDGGAGDEVRIAAINEIAEAFNSHIIGLYFNIMPILVPSDGDVAGGIRFVELQQQARTAGDRMEKLLMERLARLQKPVEIRRFDVFSDEVADIAVRQARAADAFVGLRPNGVPEEPEQMIESVMFGGGRHLLLVPAGKPAKLKFDNVLVAWNGSRESARAVAEAIPYLYRAETVTVVCVVDDDEVEGAAERGREAVVHLTHHGINAALHHAKGRNGDVGATLIAEARRRQADLLVMGGYGHSRLREWLLGGATYDLIHGSPVPLLVAH